MKGQYTKQYEESATELSGFRALHQKKQKLDENQMQLMRTAMEKLGDAVDNLREFCGEQEHSNYVHASLAYQTVVNEIERANRIQQNPPERPARNNNREARLVSTIPFNDNTLAGFKAKVNGKIQNAILYQQSFNQHAQAMNEITTAMNNTHIPETTASNFGR